MHFQVNNQEFNSTNLLFQILVAFGLGLIMGGACIFFSSLIVLGILIGIFSLFIVIKRPEVGLCGILITTSSIVFEDQLPMISIGGISLHIPDFLLLGLIAIIIIRSLVEPSFKFVRTPLDLPILLFFGAMLFSTFLAIAHSSLDLVLTRRMLRMISYYMTFFIVTNLIRQRNQLNFLINGIFVIANIVAGVMVAQFFLGHSITIIPGRVEELSTVGVAYEGVTRIIPPGLPLVLVSFISIFCILIIERFKPIGLLFFFQFCLLGFAVLFTFLRSYWAILFMVFLLLGFILRGNARQRHIMWILTIVLVAAVIAFIISIYPNSPKIEVVGASIDRLSTLFRGETFQGQDSSFTYRLIEMQYAIPQIISHLWVGLGIGAQYRPYDARLDWGDVDGRNFIHNGHLAILLNSGLFGYLSFLWLSISFLMRGFKYWQEIPNTWTRGAFLGFTLIYLVVLISAVVNSPFLQWNWTPVIGIIMGINEVIIKTLRQGEPVD